MFVAAQIVLGRRSLWLPRAIAARSIDRAHFAKLERTLSPMLLRIESRIRPRWSSLFTLPIERASGVLALVLAAIVFLPIPLGNMLSAASIAVMGLALAERDGLLLIAAWASSIASIAVLTLGSRWALHALVEAGGAGA
jgi:hypothetical protein